MPFFFPEPAADEVSPILEHVDSTDPAPDFTASSEDLSETTESRGKRRQRLGGHIISRLDVKSWGERLKAHSHRHHSHQRSSQLRFRTVADECITEEGISESNLSVEQ